MTLRILLSMCLGGFFASAASAQLAVKVTGVEVATNQIVRRDAVLPVGGLTETVTVEAAATVLSTESATISETISERAVAELPISGRNVWSLAGTTPGVLGGTANFTGAGQRAIQNSLSMDGISSSANLLAATTMRPIADAVTEVQVQSGSTSAEYGAYLGVHVNVVTKSGTNQLHGSLYEFYQGDALDARGYFENRALPANPRRRDQFGVQMDGPILLPKPQLSPIAQNVLQFYPMPDRAGTAANLQTNSASTTDTDQILFRVDQNIGNKVRLYGRFNRQEEFNSTGGAIPVTGNTVPRLNTNTLIAYTHTLTPRLLNDFRIGHHRVDADTLNYFEANGLRSAGADLGIPGFDGDVRYNNAGIPNFTISGFTALGLGGTNWYQFDTTSQLSNVIAYSSGSHNLRAGFDARKGHLLRHRPRRRQLRVADGRAGVQGALLSRLSSTDLHVTSMNAGMKDMTNVMSKFLALGMPLKDVIVRSTWNPAKEIKLEQLGNLSVGAPADVAVLRLEKGKFGFLDQRGGRLDGTQKLGCELTLRDGAVVYDSMALPPSRGRRCRRLCRAGRSLSVSSEGKRPA